MEEENIEIIIKYKNEEKTLSPIPETFEELKQKFQNLFGQGESNDSFIFSYKIGNIINLNADNYNYELLNIKQMENPIIFVEKERFNLFDTNENLAISIVNEENSNSLENLSRSIRNLQTSDSETKQSQNKKNLEKIEKELNITNEKIKNEIEDVKKLKERIDELTGDICQKTKEDNQSDEIERIKRENEIRIKQILDKNKKFVEENREKDKEIKILKEQIKKQEEKYNEELNKKNLELVQMKKKKKDYTVKRKTVKKIRMK